MASPASPAQTRAYIVERLVGETGEPDRVTGAARLAAEGTAEGLARLLAQDLALDVAVEAGGVELVRMAEAIPPEGSGAVVIAASAVSPDALVLGIDGEAIALAVHLLFGGDPAQHALPIARALSPTECDVAALLVEEAAKAVNGSGVRSLELALPLPPAVSGPDLKKLALRDGPAVRIALRLASPCGEGMLTLTVPQRVLLKSDAPAAGPAGPEWQSRFSEEVMRSAVTLSATMPLARMTLGSLAELQVGQVLELEEGAQGNAQLSARGKTLFTCEFGKLGQNYTVRVNRPFDAGQDLIEGLLPS